MAITAQLVKELRDMTAAGMMDCKKALVEVEGDLEKAVDWLRQKGMAKAAKKSGRATSEGLVTVAASADGMHIAMGSLLCETDFVARGEQFQTMATRVTQVILEKAPADAAAVAVTSARPTPRVTRVLAKRRFSSVPGSLDTGTASPVSRDSLASSWPSISVASAAMRSPSSTASIRGEPGHAGRWDQTALRRSTPTCAHC